MHKILVIAIAFAPPLAALAAPPAPAATTTAPAPATNTAAPLQPPTTLTQSDRLKAMYARIPELRAQADIAELEARIRTANAVNSGTSAAGLATPLPNTSLPTKAPNTVAPARVSSSAIDLVSIRAYNNEYSAFLQTDGAVVPVVVGDVVGDGWKVSGITARQVELIRKGHPPLILRIM